MKKITSLIFFMFIIFFSITSYANQSWNAFLQQIKKEAISQGISPDVVNQAFNGITAPNRRILRLDRSQPERRLSFLHYRNTRADAYRITLGQKEIRKHQQLLSQISQQYGVNPCFIVSLWGLETSYGRFMGQFPVIQSLATLAYDNRRAEFFRKELLIALHILNDGHVQPHAFKGEWAGASGHPQFLPSSWQNYAVDHDGDGHKDIWNSLPDAFASIANYLRKNGWASDQPWAIPVTVPASFSKHLMNLDVTKSISEWQQLGVRPQQGESLPKSNLEVSIIQPDGGPTLMIFNNFKVIMKWNRSTYYAGTVGYMAERICQKQIR